MATTFTTTLVPGGKAPYTTWTFIELPPEVVSSLGPGRPLPVRGSLAGTPFRGTASRGEGVVRVPITQELMAAAGVARGDIVEVVLEGDPEPRPVEIPAELRSLLDQHTDLSTLFERLPPSQQRAWAAYGADAKRPETRARRLAAAPEGIRTRSWPR